MSEGTLQSVADDLVTTAVGDLPESQITFEFIPQPASVGVWLVAHEGRYNGNDPAVLAAIEQWNAETGRNGVIRRDVWAIIKRGQVAQAEQGN